MRIGISTGSMKKDYILNKIVKAILISACFPSLSYSWPVVCLNCATNIQAAQAQIAQAKDYVESVQQTLNSIKQLENQAQNLAKLTQLEWGNAEEQLRALANIAAQGQALTYSVDNLNQRWTAQFKGYDAYKAQSEADIHTAEQYKKWGTTLTDTSKNALMVANKMAKLQAEDQQHLDTIQSHTRNAKGAVQVAQASNELLLQTITSLQKIQTLMQTDISMTATSIATEQDRLDAKRAATDKWYDRKLYNELRHDNGINWLNRLPSK